jgi:hypothetical protein
MIDRYFETDAEIGQKGMLSKGLTLLLTNSSLKDKESGKIIDLNFVLAQ